MNSINSSQLETFYSSYGYVQVSKEEYNSSSPTIKFTKKDSFSGIINVKINIYITKKKHLIFKIEKSTIKNNNSKFKNILWSKEKISFNSINRRANISINISFNISRK